MSPAPWRPPPPSRSGTPPSAGRSQSSGEPGQVWGGTAGPSPTPRAGAVGLSLLLAPARVADLQAEVASLRGHEERCERAVLRVLREMLQLRACVRLQDAELKRLRQDLRPAAQALEVSRRDSPAPGTPAPISGTVCAGRATRLSLPFLLAVPQPPEPKPEPDAGPGQEVAPTRRYRPNREGRGPGEGGGWGGTPGHPPAPLLVLLG